MKAKLVGLILLALPVALSAASGHGIKLENPRIEIHDKASLQRGAKYFMNYCVTCHSLQYMRYEQLATGLGMTDEDGKVDEELVYSTLISTGAKLTDKIKTNMPADFAKQSFGVVPPDLTLVARSRGVNWLYTYFNSFYSDPKRPLGTNNFLFPDVAMPNVFQAMQGTQLPVYRMESKQIDGNPTEVEVVDHLRLDSKGTMTPNEFDHMTRDLVNFLQYVAEPTKVERHRLGIWVMLFLVLFLIVAYLLKKEYWRDVH